MESVFCFDVAVDSLTLKKRVKCETPYLAIAFLDFPTILIHLNGKTKRQNNCYHFQKGKSCLFKMSPTQLYQQLTSTEIYLIVLDKSSEKKCIGSSAFSLKQTIKEVIGDLQTNGIHQTSCHGATGSVTLTNFMHATVGYVDITYKLTSLGHSILPHLSTLAVSEKHPPLVHIENHKKSDTMPVDNVVCPPPLFYVANSDPANPEKENNVQNTKSSVSSSAKSSEKKVEKKDSVDQSPTQKVDKKFLSVNTMGDHKCEGTQTDGNTLQQYPVLEALVKEVLQLGFDRPASAPVVYPSCKEVAQEQAKKRSPKRPLSTGHIKTKSKLLNQSVKQQKGVLKNGNNKPLQYPLQYGLTKSLRLRMEMSQKQDKPVKLHKTKPKQKVKNKPLLKKGTVKKQTKFTEQPQHIEPKTSLEMFSPEKSISEEFASEHLSLDDLRQTSTEDVVTVRDPSSPRALSRQSIEIRLPTATSSYNDDDHIQEHSEKYKYSDDFDDDQVSYERSTSALTNLESSPQNTGVELSVDFGAPNSPQRLSLDVSPQPTASDVSVSPTLGATYLKVEPTHEHEEESVEVSPKSSGNMDSPGSWKYSLPRHELTDEGESKHTDTSSSVATAMMTPILPVPRPSDSPVIRSLASEPPSRSRNPHPPSMSHSSSYERIRRKFKRSSESSFHISDVSDIRTSDLADIKTSDISEIRSSDEMSTRLATQRYIANPSDYLE